MERGGVQGIQFIVQIVLARLLLPEDFGVIAIVGVFISFSNVFIQSGLNTALIQKKNADEKDFSTVLFLSLGLAILLYLVIFFIAPLISEFYQEDQLIKILRVYSLVLFVGALNSIQNAYVAKYMLFKKLFFSSLISVVFSGVIGILCAFLEFGVWALIIQQLMNQISIFIALWFTLQWRPQLEFSPARVKTLFSFGWKVLVSNLIHVLYMDLRTLIIGKIYTSSALGFYNRGETFPKLIVSNIDGSIQSVMLPTFSAHQENTNRIKGMVRRTIVTSAFLVFPSMIGLAAVAESLVELILTEKWLDSVQFLQIFCLTYAILPIQTVNLQAVTAMGRSDIALKLQIIKKTAGILILLISIPFGIHAIALGTAISALIAALVNIYPNSKLLNYSYIEQFKDIFPIIITSLLMGVLVNVINGWDIEVIFKLVLQIIVGLMFYLFISKLFRIESLDYLIDTLKDFKNKNLKEN